MAYRLLSRRGLLTTACLLATVAALPSPVAAQCLAVDSGIVVNRRSVPTEGVTNLMGLLSRVVSAPQLRGRSVRASDQPIVLMDGVELAAGVRSLDDIPLMQVQSVTTLRPVDAVARYGGKAQGGAIMVETRQGRVARGQPHTPVCAIRREP